MAAVSLAIVDRDDKPIYCTEFASKYHWHQEEGISSEEELFGLNLSSTAADAADEKDCGIVASIDASGLFPCSLKQQFMLQTALDRFVQKSGPPPGYHWRSPGAVAGTPDAMFVGLLCPVEDFRVYGYAMTTQMKIIVVVEDDEFIPASLSEQQSTSDDRTKALMAKIHKHYIEYTLNPFSKLEGPIESETFKRKVGEEVERFNRVAS